MKNYRIIFWLTFAFFLVADRITKHFVLTGLRAGKPYPLIKGILNLNLVKNTGLAFGMLQGLNKYLFIVITVILLAAILVYYFTGKPEGILINLSLGLVSAGAIGNLIDRCLYGNVVDFIDFRVWPVFNVADSCVVAGIIGIVLVYTFMDEKL